MLEDFTTAVGVDFVLTRTGHFNVSVKMDILEMVTPVEVIHIVCLSHYNCINSIEIQITILKMPCETGVFYSSA